nr:immunoglobulin light chain junction region [Macaca mulatta]
CQQHGDSPLTF